MHAHAYQRDIAAAIGRLLWAQLPAPIDLAGASPNGVVTPGEYFQFGSTPITEANGYPPGVANASHIRVFLFGGSNAVFQELTCWLNPQKWVRSTNNAGSTWQTWAKL